MKKLLLTLLAVLWLTPVFAEGLSDMTDAERQTFRDEVRAYLLDNPEVLMEAIKVLEGRQQDQQAQTDEMMVVANQSAIYDDGYSYVGGNPDGDITLVEFLDYRCTYCRRAHDEVAELIKSDGNIRLVVKEFPILGEQSTLSSQLAVATLHKAGPVAYNKLGDFLMTFNGNLTPKIMTGILTKLEVAEPEDIIAYMKGDTVAQQIGATRQLASLLKISGTPTFVIGDEMLRGYAPLKTMREIVAYHRDQIGE